VHGETAWRRRAAAHIAFAHGPAVRAGHEGSAAREADTAFVRHHPQLVALPGRRPEAQLEAPIDELSGDRRGVSARSGAEEGGEDEDQPHCG
jgi:hypothetical protein